MFRKELPHALISKAKSTMQRVHFPSSQACQSPAWGREQEHCCWGLLHQTAAAAALELLGKVTPGRPMALEVHSLQIAPFPTPTLLLSSGVDNTSWHLGCDRKIDEFFYIRYYSWINKSEKKGQPFENNRRNLSGIMWEVHLTHQVATIIFLYFFHFLVLASHWQREREMGNIPGVS